MEGPPHRQTDIVAYISISRYKADRSKREKAFEQQFEQGIGMG